MMKLRRVILESPFRGNDIEEQYRNIRYAQAAMLDSLGRGESPFASHLMWPGILDDADANQREAGIEAGLAWGPAAEATVVYTDLGISPGMKKGIARANAEGRPVDKRSLPAWVGERSRRRDKTKGMAPSHPGMEITHG